MERTMIAALAVIVAYIVYKAISAGARGEKKKTFKKEYEEILNKEEYKVKGRFEC